MNNLSILFCSLRPEAKLGFEYISRVAYYRLDDDQIT